LMTLAAPSLAPLTVSSRFTSTHILQTFKMTSTSLLVTRVRILMTQVYSTAHTFLSRWFVQLAKTPSSPRLASRLVTVCRQTHLQLVSSTMVLSQPLVSVLQTQTATTEEYVLPTSCDPFTYSQRVFGPSFFMLINNRKYFLNHGTSYLK